MNPALLDILRCPRSQQRLTFDQPDYRDSRVRSGWLVSEDGQHRYPIRDFIPRFIPPSNYADNFGMQWNKFRKTQLDSHSGHPISADRFWKATGWRPEMVAGRWVLDVGCGAGRFAEVALNAGARVLALDYSSAVDACFANLSDYPNLHVVQGDIYALPLLKGSFPFIYSLGVLQHTPDVARAFAALPPMLGDAAYLCVDVYWKRVRTMLHGKYVLRPLTTRLSRERLFHAVQASIPAMLPVSQTLGRVPAVGRYLKRLIPISDYTGIYPLNPEQLEEWALLDTFDMLAPAYDNPQTARTLRRWFEDAGLVDVEVFHEGHLVARGRKRVQS